MARMPIITYKNSVLASIVSILGSIILFAGLFALAEDVTVTMVLVPLGVAMLYGASEISKSKAFNLWLKGLKSKGVIERLPEDNQLCILLYHANPSWRTLNLIKKHNLSAAEEIEKIKAEMKAQKKAQKEEQKKNKKK